MHTKVQEAMAAGLPVIGYRPIMSAFGPGDGIYFYSVNNEKDLTKKCLKLIKEKDTRILIGKNARDFSKHEFNLNKIGRKLVLDYREISNLS